jgi:hypothetical protein
MIPDSILTLKHLKIPIMGIKRPPGIPEKLIFKTMIFKPVH